MSMSCAWDRNSSTITTKIGVVKWSDIVVEWSRNACHDISQASAYGSCGRCTPQHQLGVSIWVTSSINGPRVDVRISECCAPQPLHQWGVHPGLLAKGNNNWSSGVNVVVEFPQMRNEEYHGHNSHNPGSSGLR